MSLSYRISRIKAVPFLDAFTALAPAEFELPEQLPQHVLCLLPDHQEKTGSFYLQEHRWQCFGCDRGGDAIDFVQELHGVSLAVAVTLAEHALDLAQDEDELAVLVARARATGVDPGPRRSDWTDAVHQIEVEFFDRVRPFLRCLDPVVQGFAWSRAEYVFTELDRATAGDRQAPRTERGLREQARALRGFAYGWARGLGRDVWRCTGKDRLDVALQGPWPL